MLVSLPAEEMLSSYALSRHKLDNSLIDNVYTKVKVVTDSRTHLP